MSFKQFTSPSTTLCLYNISPKTSSLLAAIHLFISSHDEIKDFCSMDKKNWSPLRTACTYLYINHHFHIHKNILLLQFYMHLYASVTAGSVNPAAIYHVRTIYNPTNNVVPIQYLPNTPNIKYNTPSLISIK